MSPSDDDRVVALPREVIEEPVPAPTPPGRLHGYAIAGMATCALIGIVALIAFITIGWPGDTGRYVIFAFILAGLGFLAFASTAVLAAARDTYARDRSVKRDE